MADSEVQKLIIWVGSQAKINQAREQGLIGDDDFTCVTGLPEFALQSEVQAIQVLIPSAATVQNQLADRDYVNSSINNMAAFYVTSDVQGDPFATRTDLLAGPWYNKGVERTPTLNDYALVTEDKTHDGLTSRYMYDGTQWVWQYTLNNTKFTQAQIDAINSTITKALVDQITANQNNIGDLNSLQTSAKTSTVAAINELQNGKQATINDLATIRSGATAGTTAIQGVQINGTDLTKDTNNKVNIPVASANVNGVVRTNTNKGITALSGQLETIPASTAEITSKTNGYKVVVPSNLDIAIREGLGNNSLTWTDAYKLSACKTIGTVSGVQINGTDLTPDSTTNKVNIPIAGGNASSLGVIYASGGYGLTTNTSTGLIRTVCATEAQVIAKTNTYNPITPSVLDISIREGLGNNDLTWTDAYKESARNTIGAEAQAMIQILSATDSITLADNTIYNGGEQTALTIALPATVSVSFLCEIDFTSGTTATTLTYPNTIKWLGDDVANNVFVPVANKRYTIICAYDGVNYRATVKGV